MNPLILFLAGGYSFWVGLMLISALLIPTSQRPSSLILKSLALFAGLILIAVSMTPIAIWWYAGLLVASIYWLIAYRTKQPLAERQSLARRGIAVCLLSALVLEWPYAVLPKVPVPEHRTLVILADSLTAGLEENDFTWPERLAERVDSPIEDLSHVGAVVKDGLTMIENVDLDGKLVLIELGGNDLLGSTPADEFHRNLNELLQRLTAADCAVVMFELPLPPFRYDIAYAQRSLCNRYDVSLIPKQYLLRAIAGEGKTVDSLHLSEQGHVQLADFMESFLQPAFSR
ncbi:MAG: hypothetical protein HUJ26_07420 [Planctomycetaceae bacterium]|nr:hypothetical protein [Planctomycetaceae bacterium]